MERPELVDRPPPTLDPALVHPSRLLLSAGTGDESRAWVLIVIPEEPDALPEL